MAECKDSIQLRFDSTLGFVEDNRGRHPASEKGPGKFV